MKQFAVIGLGRFGSSVARTLWEKGQQVVAIDNKEELVHEIMENVTKAVCLDATEAKAMKSVGIQNVDVAVCAIGTNVEASILVTLLLKELGIQTIVCKAINEAHKRALEKIGATKVVLPERDMGARIANTLISTSDKVLEHIDLTADSSIIELVAPEMFIGKTLRELNVRAAYGVNVIAIKRKVKNPKSPAEEGERSSVVPMADDVVMNDDILILYGANEDIDALKMRLKEKGPQKESGQ